MTCTSLYKSQKVFCKNADVADFRTGWAASDKDMQKDERHTNFKWTDPLLLSSRWYQSICDLTLWIWGISIYSSLLSMFCLHCHRCYCCCCHCCCNRHCPHCHVMVAILAAAVAIAVWWRCVGWQPTQHKRVTCDHHAALWPQEPDYRSVEHVLRDRANIPFDFINFLCHSLATALVHKAWYSPLYPLSLCFERLRYVTHSYL